MRNEERYFVNQPAGSLAENFCSPDAKPHLEYAERRQCENKTLVQKFYEGIPHIQNIKRFHCSQVYVISFEP